MIQTPNNKKYSRYQGKEDDLQEAVGRYLNAKNLTWFHTPNERKMGRLAGWHANNLGRKAGVPDVLIFNPKNFYAGLAIELKVGKNKPSVKQWEWLENLDKLGWKTAWTNSLDEALDIVEDYLSEKRPEFPENRSTKGMDNV